MELQIVLIIYGLCYSLVYCWPCPQDVTRVYARPGSRAMISFQTSIQSASGVSTYYIAASNGSNLYTSTYYNGEFKSERERFDSMFIGDATTGNFTIQTNNLQTMDAGVYMLGYTVSSFATTEQCSTLYILGIPTQPNISSINDPSVGEDATLTCESTSTTVPTNHSLNRSYNWNVDNSAVTSSGKYSLSGNTLVVSNVAKIDKDLKFICTSTEVVTNGYTSDSSGEYSINVVYCGNPGIANAQYTGNTQFGDTVTFTCNTNYTLTGSENATCESTGSWTTLPTCTVTLKRGLPLQYGAAQRDRNVTGTEDACAVQINTDCYIPFKGNQFKTIFICTNGLVCFGTKYQSYSIPSNGEDISNTANCLAPYFADIDLRQTGIIWYQTYNLSDISLVDTTVKELITGTYGVNFNPVYILKATWEGAPQYGANINNTVTFQIIYVTDGLTAYTHFHYDEDGMNFPFGPQYIGLMYDGLAYGIDDNENGTYLARPDLHFVSGNYAGAISFNLLGGTSSSNCFSGASASVSSSIMSPTSSSTSTTSSSMMFSSTSASAACASFSGPGNGAVNFQCFTEGCTAQFSCNAGYTLTGNSSTTCQNQAWDREYPTCVPIDCVNPGVANVHYTGNTQFGDTVTFTCNINYTLTGSENATCESTGSWTTLPTCTVNSPRPPTYFVYTGSVNNIPTFILLGGFNGGAEQTFIIQTTVFGTVNWIEQMRFRDNDGTYRQLNGLHIFNITGLSSNTYSVRVLAENAYGQLDEMDALSVQITVANQDPEIPTFPVAVVTGWVSTIIVALIIAAGVVLFYKRRYSQKDRNPSRSAHRSTNNTTVEDTAYYNVANQGATNSQQSAVSAQEHDLQDVSTYEALDARHDALETYSSLTTVAENHAGNVTYENFLLHKMSS